MIRQRTISCSPAEHSMCSEHVCTIHRGAHATTSSSARLHRFSLHFERRENLRKAPSMLQGQKYLWARRLAVTVWPTQLRAKSGQRLLPWQGTTFVLLIRLRALTHHTPISSVRLIWTLWPYLHTHNQLSCTDGKNVVFSLPSFS